MDDTFGRLQLNCYGIVFDVTCFILRCGSDAVCRFSSIISKKETWCAASMTEHYPFYESIQSIYWKFNFRFEDNLIFGAALKMYIIMVTLSPKPPAKTLSDSRAHTHRKTIGSRTRRRRRSIDDSSTERDHKILTRLPMHIEYISM